MTVCSAHAYDGRTTRTVTAVTDTLIDSTSRGGQMMGGLARHFDAQAGVRVLALAGRGGVSNLNDLLYLRGVDLAVVNADVMAHLQGTQLGALAKRELRYVSKLYDQRVLLVTRSAISSIQELSGKVIGIRAERPDTRTTAETLFRLLEVPVRFEALSLQPDAQPAQDALVFLESELAEAGGLIGALSDYRILPIPFDDRLAAAYRPAQVAARELPRLTARRPITTIRVDTILAVYNWRVGATRRADVVAFIGTFYTQLAKLRQGADGMLWRQVGVAADVPGWTRYASAEPSRYLDPARLAEVATVSRAAFLLNEPVAPADDAEGSNTAEAKPPQSIAVLAFERPPFSARQLQNGGPALKLVRDALAMANRTQPLAIEWVTSLADESLLPLIESNRFDVIVPWPYFPCEQPARLTGPTAHICDNARFSKPLFTDILRLFLPTGSKIDLGEPKTLTKRRICIADPGHVAIITATNGDWERRYEVEYLVRQSVIACLSSVQQGEADGVVGSEAELHTALDALGIRALFKSAEQPVGIQSWTAVVPSDRSPALLADIDAGLERARGRSDASGAQGSHQNVDGSATATQAGAPN